MLDLLLELLSAIAELLLEGLLEMAMGASFDVILRLVSEASDFLENISPPTATLIYGFLGALAGGFSLPISPTSSSILRASLALAFWSAPCSPALHSQSSAVSSVAGRNRRSGLNPSVMDMPSPVEWPSLDFCLRIESGEFKSAPEPEVEVASEVFPQPHHVASALALHNVPSSPSREARGQGAFGSVLELGSEFSASKFFETKILPVNDCAIDYFAMFPLCRCSRDSGGGGGYPDVSHFPYRERSRRNFFFEGIHRNEQTQNGNRRSAE